MFELIKPFIEAVDGEHTDIHLQSMAEHAKRLKKALTDNPQIKALLEKEKVNIEEGGGNYDPMIT